MNNKKYRQDLSYYFDRMSTSFKKSDAEGIEGVLEFEILSAEGSEKWFMLIRNDACSVTQSEMKSDTKILIAKELFIEGFMGKANMIEAFMEHKYTILGNLELAMSMDFIFDKAKPYNEWFYTLEAKHLPETSQNKRTVYRFSILDETVYEDGIPMNEPEYRYRNVILENGTCKVVTLDEIPYDVEFVFKEQSLMDLIEGKTSYYDLFLLKQFTFNGPNKEIFEFPSYFERDIFPNIAIKYLTVNNVFDQMPRMVDEIPPRLQNKILCMNITGREGGIFYIRILENTIKVIPKDEVEKINAKITMNTVTFFGFCFNEIDYHSALEEEDILFQGDVNVGMTFDTIFKYRFVRTSEEVGAYTNV